MTIGCCADALPTASIAAAASASEYASFIDASDENRQYVEFVFELGAQFSRALRSLVNRLPTNKGGRNKATVGGDRRGTHARQRDASRHTVPSAASTCCTPGQPPRAFAGSRLIFDIDTDP